MDDYLRNTYMTDDLKTDSEDVHSLAILKRIENPFILFRMFRSAWFMVLDYVASFLGSGFISELFGSYIRLKEASTVFSVN